MRKMAAFICTLLITLGFVTMMRTTLAAEHRTIQRSENDPWFELQQRVPYPYTVPLPEDIPSEADGTYVKFEAKETPPTPCRRCPDYKPEGGWWKLSLSRGVFRILHMATGWKSIGSYTIIGDRIMLANDPVCPRLTGAYRWTRMKGYVTFSTVEDGCSAGLRAMSFSGLPWQSCSPPSVEAAVSDHWPRPQGCDPP